MGNKKDEHQSFHRQASGEKRSVCAKSLHTPNLYLSQITKCFKTLILDASSMKNCFLKSIYEK